MSGQYCFECKRLLDKNDIGLHKKLINRNSDEFMCIECIAKYYNVSTDILEQKIVQFKKAGCLLFE